MEVTIALPRGWASMAADKAERIVNGLNNGVLRRWIKEDEKDKVLGHIAKLKKCLRIEKSKRSSLRRGE